MVDEVPVAVLPLAPVPQIASLDVVGPGVSMPSNQLELTPQVPEAPAPVVKPPVPVPVPPAPIVYVPKQDRN